MDEVEGIYCLNCGGRIRLGFERRWTHVESGLTRCLGEDAAEVGPGGFCLHCAAVAKVGPGGRAVHAATALRPCIGEDSAEPGLA